MSPRVLRWRRSNRSPRCRCRRRPDRSRPRWPPARRGGQPRNYTELNLQPSLALPRYSIPNGFGTGHRDCSLAGLAPPRPFFSPTPFSPRAAFPPWWPAHRVFEAAASADAAIVRTTAIAAILVVRPNEHEGLTRLREAGAWLTLDPQAVAACFNNSDGKI